MNSRLIWIFAGLFVAALSWFGMELLGKTSIDEFLSRHWAYPVPAQGQPPANFSALEASLGAQSCGQCHIQQYAQWQDSLHSHAMGPGILWQMELAGLETARSCLRCHAPMKEQLALLAQELGWTQSDLPAPDYIPAGLHTDGLVCAACHVRSHTRYGPEPVAETTLSSDVKVHGGFVAHKAFADSRFCANCHQFAEDGPRLNGKLREDTYQQWRSTVFAEQQRACQSCHMPDRQHLWKGIHDVEMTRSALTVELEAELDAPGFVSARAKITNSGAGHHFPTYLVPEVLLYLELVHADGLVTKLDSYTIAWRSNLALDREIFDQRLPAGKSVTLSGRTAYTASGGSIRLRISVAPRQHYMRTFEKYLADNQQQLTPSVIQLLQQAIAEGNALKYEFVASERPLSGIAN